MNKLFSMDGPLFTFCEKVADLFILNIAFLLSCLPVFTIGPALSALYSVTMDMVRKDQSNIFKKYFMKFKQYYRQSFLVSLVFIFIGIFLFFDYKVFEIMPAPISFLRYMILITAVYVCFALLYVFCIIPVFDNKVKNALRNAFVLPIAHLPWTLLIFAIHVLIVYASLHDISAFVQYWIILWLSIGFAAIAYICSFLFYRAFMSYFPEWEEEYKKDMEELKKETTR